MYNKRDLLQCQKRPTTVSIDMYNNDVGQESAQKFMKQTYY